MANLFVLRPALWRAAFGAATAVFSLTSLAYAAPQTGQAPAVATPAAAPTPVGDWYTIHDETKKATSVVRIAWEGDQLVGRVVEVLASTRGPNPRCERCEGERKDKPVVGMSILWDLRGKQGSYDGGYVLDPSKGKIYRAKVKMRSPDVLEMRGFIGMSVFGRTQVWQRVPPGDRPAAPGAAQPQPQAAP